MESENTIKNEEVFIINILNIIRYVKYINIIYNIHRKNSFSLWTNRNSLSLPLYLFTFYILLLPHVFTSNAYYVVFQHTKTLLIYSQAQKVAYEFGN